MDGLTYTDIKHYLWRKGNLQWLLWDQQRPIHETIKNLPYDANVVVLLCARQFGKSVTGCVLALEDCLQTPNIAVMIVAPEIKHARAIVNPRLRMLTQSAPEGLVKFHKSEDRWQIGRSEIILGGFDIKNASRQRGKTLHKVYIEEIVDSDPDSYREAIRSDIGPALTHSDHAQIIYLTTLPKIPDHPFILDTVPEAQLFGAFFKYTIDDNKHLTQEQYDACVKLAGGKDSVEFRREYMCEFVRDENVMIIPSFSERHVENFELPLETRYFVTVDFGGVRDKTVGLLHTYDFFNDKHLIIDERVFDANTPTSEIVADLLHMETIHKVTVQQRISDCPGQLLVDLTQVGYDVMMPIKTDWKASVNQMSVLFATNKVLIHPRCAFTIQSCRSGAFNKLKTDFGRSTVLGHCDALAAMMYGLRAIDKSNPYGVTTGGHPEGFWIPPQPKDDPLVEVKTFGHKRKFGAFR